MQETQMKRSKLDPLGQAEYGILATAGGDPVSLPQPEHNPPDVSNAATLPMLGHEELAERARRVEDSFDQLHAILDGVADGITAQGPSGQVIYANTAAARLIGYASAEDLQRTPPSELLRAFELFDEAGNPFPVDQLPSRLALTGMHPPETLIRFREVATGEERWLLVKSAPVKDEHGRVRLAINIFRDITAQRRDEEAQRFLAEATGLLASSLDYQTTLEQVARLAVPKISDWCVVDVVDDSGEARRLALAHVDPAKVAVARKLQEIYPPDSDESQGVTKVLKTGRPEMIPEISDELLTRAAKDEHHLQLLRQVGMKSAMVVPMVARSRILGAISFVSAESGRRFDFNDLELAQHLGRRAALAVDNARLYGEAQEALHLRNELFSGISHDLKNPLTGIKGMAQLLMRQVRRMETPDRDRLVEGLESIDSIASRMSAQINELLDVARLQMGQPLELESRPVEIVKLVREIVSEHQKSTEAHNIRLVTSVPRLVGDWDEVRLARVISNLLSNAVKYSPSGGDVLVEVSREENESGSWALVSVRDWGLGIPRDELSKVFLGFRRGRNVTGIQGTGIGLASARQIVELHGGRIAVSSMEGNGSTFTVWLPVGPRVSSQAEASPTLPEAA